MGRASLRMRWKAHAESLSCRMAGADQSVSQRVKRTLSAHVTRAYVGDAGEVSVCQARPLALASRLEPGADVHRGSPPIGRRSAS